MADGKNPYRFRFFKSDTTSSVRNRGILFFMMFTAIILIQSCYWLFANQAAPIVLGMPFGLFFITVFIIVEFVLLLTLFILEGKDGE